MAKARMLHKTISISMDVNRLPLPARLLFTWMISHADDEGRLKGEPEYIKATVVPMTKWSFKKIEQWLKEIEKVGLIHYWEKNGERFVEFIKWTDYQYIQKDRLKPSKLPSYNKESGYNLDTDRIQTDDTLSTQSNISDSNLNKANKNEANEIDIAEKLYEGSGFPPKITYLIAKGKNNLKGMEQIRKQMDKLGIKRKIT